jgi:hypothetical protein
LKGALTAALCGFDRAEPRTQSDTDIRGFQNNDVTVGFVSTRSPGKKDYPSRSLKFFLGGYDWTREMRLFSFPTDQVTSRPDRNFSDTYSPSLWAFDGT